MEQLAVDTLRRAVAKATNWVPAGGDTNLMDVHEHAERVAEILGLVLPSALPSNPSGVRLVELVDRELISGTLIRSLAPDELARRAVTLTARIREAELLKHAASANYIVALYIWHGCIHMAKSLRPTYRTTLGEVPYSLAQRQEAYSVIEQWWKAADQRGNPYVRFGVTLARALEHGRGNRVVDDWVPRESPYRERS
ncbi:MAG: hypothetical protein HY678_12605 [Chloroflexi bacterium]|nr:hypothetical protein [Chloroflexota bacterium]